MDIVFQLKQTLCRVEIDPPFPAVILWLFGMNSMSNITVYEGDSLMRALIEEWLCGAGYHVNTAARPGQPADLVIASVSSPKDSGALQVRKIQAGHPGTPLIAISAQFRSGLSTAGAIAEKLGAHRVIAKPLSRADLLEAVRAIIGSPG